MILNKNISAADRVDQLRTMLEQQMAHTQEMLDEVEEIHKVLSEEKE